MRINNNVAAFNAYRNLAANGNAVSKSLEKLSSGLRINRAGDDAAGLVISQSLRSQVGGLTQATRNAQDGISVVQTAEGALNEVHNMLGRMRDLAVQASNTGANDSAARTAANNEVTALRTEIDKIAGETKFGSTKLLDGSYGGVGPQTATGAGALDGTTDLSSGNDFTIQFGTDTAVTVSWDAATGLSNEDVVSYVEGRIKSALQAAGQSENAASVSVSLDDTDHVVIKSNSAKTMALVDGATTPGLAEIGLTGTIAVEPGKTQGGTFQVGANADETIDVTIKDMKITGGTETTMAALADIDLVDEAADAIKVIDDAIATVSATRGDLGAAQNRFESRIANLQVTTENLTASESRIRDTDYSQEMVKFTRGQILNQAATSMLGQANRLPQGVLSLLQG